MYYGYSIDGVITAPVAMCSRFGDVGGWHLLTDAERAVHGWYPCTAVNEVFNSRTHTQDDIPTLTFDGELITCTWTLREKTLATVLAEADADLMAYRFGIETGGITLANGMRVDTTREEVSLLTSVFTTLSAGFVTTVDWKSPTGWVSATLEGVTPLARAATLHVQRCFSAERKVSELLTASETIEAILAIDVRELFDAKLAELTPAEEAPAPVEAEEPAADDPEPGASA